MGKNYSCRFGIISIIWDIVKKDDHGRDKKKGEKKLIYDPKTKDDESVREIEFDYTKNN